MIRLKQLPAFLAGKALRFLLRYLVLLDRLDPRGRLAFTYLRGNGIEIGALHRPLSCDWRKVHITYVDRKSRAELARQYPEFRQEDIMRVDRIDSGETLATFADQSLDFVIASHMIEHAEDPVGTLDTWFRVLRPQGMLFLIVPDMRHTFDRQRAQTTPGHLFRDHEEGPERSRQHHYLEWVACTEGGDAAARKQRAEELAAMHYSIHFHVWTPLSFLDFLVAYHGRYPHFDIRHLEQNKKEFIVILQKTG